MTADIRRRRPRALHQSWLLRYVTPADRIDPSYPSRAACRGLNVDDVTVTTCDGCPVRLDCLHDAFRHEHDLAASHIFHVRGGLTPTARAKAVASYRRINPAAVHPLVAAVMEAESVA